jgi:hypothetical protein
MPRSPIAWRLLTGLAFARIALYLLSSGPLAYGSMSDELYDLDSTDHLDWGYVDHRPLSIAVLWAVRSVLGQSLLALGLVPALLGAGTILLVGVLARELGVGLMWMDLRALGTGWLPCGSNGLRARLEIQRETQPLGFWILFAAYAAGGAWMVVFALRVLAGYAAPLPLR